jgi:hypothetical protein
MLRETNTSRNRKCARAHPHREEIQAKRLNDLMTKIMMWLKRGRAKKTRVMESLLADGVDPLDCSHCLKLPVLKKSSADCTFSPLPEKAVRPERRPHTSAGFTARGAAKAKASRRAATEGRPTEEPAGQRRPPA